MKRKIPTPLGVLEFTSALNGEDPHTILQKLRHFVHVTRYQRQVALGAIDGSDDDDVMDDERNGDEESICSLFEEGDSSKRRRLDDKDDKTPAWQMDKNDYRVPFVGTSVAKGDVGSVVVGTWPTGFLEVYRKHSPLGVELLRNDYISALPPNGIHKSLCKGATFTANSGKKRKSDESELTRSQIISLSLQNYYWMALSEWVLGFVPIDMLKKDLYLESDDSNSELSSERNTKGGKCAIPPEMMTILMKQRMPEWIDTIQNYVYQQHQHSQQLIKIKQQHKQQRKKQDKLSKEEQQMQSKVQQQQAEKLKQQQVKWEKKQLRDGVLLTSALQNLRTMCFVSMGTAREVLRRLSMAGDPSKSTTNGQKSRGKTGGKGGSSDGTAWMAELLQHKPISIEKSSSSTSEYCNPQVECLNLVCTLLETKDYTILSRLCQAPSWSLKQVNRGGKDTKADNMGLVYVALKCGIQYLLDAYTADDGKIEAVNAESERFERSVGRLLRDVRDFLLPGKAGDDAGTDKANQRTEGFILGAGATADLFSGEVLVSLTKLSLLAPSFEATASFVSGIVRGKDSYEDLNSIEGVAVEARRLLFTLLSDAERSPFLNVIRFRDRADQAEAHFSQLSKALHSLLLDRANNQIMRVFLRTCLATTPHLLPYVFRGLYLSDPKPNYRTLSSLTFVERVVSDAPSAQAVLLSYQQGGQTAHISRDYIVPTCVSKVLLGKVIQSSSALILSSGLKLIATLLDRASEFVSALSDSTTHGSTIRESVLQHLPQISLLLSIPTRFDPFEENGSQSNAVVVLELCKTIQSYGRLDSSLITNLQFDWVKLLPIESEQEQDGPLRSFINVEPCCLVAILQLLNSVSRLDNTTSPKMLTHVLCILTSTKILDVYDAARELALSLVEKELFNTTCRIQQDTETLSCKKYECSLWVDEIGNSSISELITWIGDLQQHRVQHKIFVSQAWAKCSAGEHSMPPLCVSVLFSFLISKLIQDKIELSAGFSTLLIRMATKLLIFLSDPIPLASIIVHAADSSAQVDGQCINLCRFATSIIQNDERAYCALDLIPFTMFYAEKRDVEMEPHFHTNIPIVLRQCLSLMKYQSGSYDKLSSLLRKVLSYAIESQEHDIIAITTVIVSAFERKTLRLNDMKCASTFLLAASSSKRDCVSTMLASVEESSFELELTCSILQLATASIGIPRVINDVLERTISTTQHGNSNRRDFLLAVLLEITDKTTASQFPPKAIFRLWASLSDHFVTDSAIKLCMRLEECLSRVFKAGDEQGQWIVYQTIIECPQQFVEKCIQTMKKLAHLSDSKEDVAAGCFLSSVLTYDCSEFACLAKTLSDTEQDGELAKLLNEGSLDLIASTFLTQTQQQSSCTSITSDPLYGRAASVIGRRLTSLLEQEGPRHIPIQRNLQLLQTLCHIGSMPSNLPAKLLDLVSALQNGSRIESAEDEIHVIELVVCSCQRLNDTKILLAHAFVRCCKILPKLLKSFLRNKQAELSSSFLRLASLLMQLLERISDFDQDIVSSHSSVVEKIIVTCLKYGIMEADDKNTCLINGECLKTVRLILKESHDNGASLIGITPGQIHSMVISHSSFQGAISGKDYHAPLPSNGVTQQMELIRLLTFCVSIDSQHVKLDDATWTMISSAFNASTTCTDKMFRQLIYLYEANNCFEEEMMLMSSYRWGAAGRQQNSDKDGGWDWLLDALDSNRVRATLMQFPVSDTLEPPLDTSANINNKETADDDEVSLSGEEGYDHEDDSHASASAMSSSQKLIISKQSNCDEWRGSGEDTRYSPGFILPLVLGALEEHLPVEQDTGSESPKSVSKIQEADVTDDDSTSEVREQHQAFCHFSRRLCDRGAIALALASLSSRCPSIRKVAVSICGVFLKALQMKESQSIKSWHERPQLEMLMSSVQRGLAVRRAMQLQKAKEAHESGPINTPMLPAVSAVFLAKSLMVISRPADDMYGPINRYFLRLNDHHGAFQDCFTLPAFLSLYCNASDDQSKCKVERNWALLALKDGTVDDFCYRIICQSHIPELVMSSLDSSMGNPDYTSEVSLTVEVISSLIRSGGSRASNHMIHRLGILSWLHGIVSWREFSSVLPYTSLKCKYLRLICAAVQAYNQNDTPDMQFFEKVPLSNTVIKICLAAGSSGEKSDSSDASLLECTCDALWEIHAADQKSHDNSADFICGQTALDDMASLLTQFVPQELMFQKVLASLCNLPLVATPDSSSARLFSKLALGYVAHHKTTNTIPKLLLHVLKRVTELMVKYPQIASDEVITTLMLKCRQMAVLEDGAIQAWEQIMVLCQANSQSTE